MCVCFIEIEVFEWVTLRENPLWAKVEGSYIFISNHWSINILDGELFNELLFVKKNTSQTKKSTNGVRITKLG